MGTTVRDIVDNAESIALGILGSPYKVLRRLYTLERNSGRDAAKAYGCRPMEADTTDTVTNTETLQHFFEFVLSDDLTRDDSDAEVQAILDAHYDKLDLIFRQFVLTQMNLGGTVIQVDERSISEPTILNKSVYLRMRFFVKYRQSL
jgi:hypothetical protein